MSKAASRDLDARSITEEEFRRARKVPRIKTLRRALGLTQGRRRSLPHIDHRPRADRPTGRHRADRGIEDAMARGDPLDFGRRISRARLASAHWSHAGADERRKRFIVFILNIDAPRVAFRARRRDASVWLLHPPSWSQRHPSPAGCRG
jgi:hypothetical protein